MNLNYNFNERKTTLTGFPKTKKLKWENFQRTYEEENKLPEYVKGNADWVKDLYRDIDSLPAVNTAAIERKNKIKSDFINEAEKIYKFDKNTREKDYIREFETDYFDSKIKEAGFNIQNSEWNNKTPYNKSEIESSSKLVNTFENKSDDNIYGDVRIEKMGNTSKYDDKTVLEPAIKGDGVKLGPETVGSRNRASDIIKDNAETIKNMGALYGVNPGIIGACIFTEQARNVNWKDRYVDEIVADIGINVSLGVGQVTIKTARMLENDGNMKNPITHKGKVPVFNGFTTVMEDVWEIPGIGRYQGTKDGAIKLRLQNVDQNIEYVAAYLRRIQDHWQEEFPEISGRTAILATLYNIGDKNPHSDPKSNPFGDYAKENYYHIRELLGYKD